MALSDGLLVSRPSHHAWHLPAARLLVANPSWRLLAGHPQVCSGSLHGKCSSDQAPGTPGRCFPTAQASCKFWRLGQEGKGGMLPSLPQVMPSLARPLCHHLLVSQISLGFFCSIQDRNRQGAAAPSKGGSAGALAGA